MAKQDEGISVFITGKNSHTREAVTGVVIEALRDKGFTDVEALNPAAERMVYPTADSMLELVREHAPQMFSEPVRVQGSFQSTQAIDVTGAFGPAPVGYFGYLKDSKEWLHVGPGVEDLELRTDPPLPIAPENAPKNAFVLYARERDFEKIQELTGAIEAEEGVPIEARLVT